MRIAHVTDCYLPRLGGIEMHVNNLAERQQQAGHEVTVITSTEGPDSPGVEVIRVRPDTGRPGRIGYRASPAVRRLLDEGGYDVVHLHPSAFSPLAYLAAHHAGRSRLPTVVTVHSLWAYARPAFHLAQLAFRWNRWPLEWAAVSEASAAELREALADRGTVNVVPNGIDPAEWQVAPVPGEPGQLRIVAVGRLAPRKRPLHLARLLLDVHQRLPEGTSLTVELIGDGPQRRRLQRYVDKHGMSGWVRLRGALEPAQIREALGRSDVFVAPAALESFGIAALEARCAGLPVLARTGTGIRDFVRQDLEGWLVASDQAMADQLVALAGDRARLERVATHNRRVAVGIDWEFVLRRYAELYRRAAARHSRPWHDPAEQSGVRIGVGGR